MEKSIRDTEEKIKTWVERIHFIENIQKSNKKTVSPRFISYYLPLFEKIPNGKEIFKNTKFIYEEHVSNDPLDQSVGGLGFKITVDEENRITEDLQALSRIEQVKTIAEDNKA